MDGKEVKPKAWLIEAMRAQLAAAVPTWALRRIRRAPAVRVVSYRCATCNSLHLGRTATLQLGCDAASAV